MRLCSGRQHPPQPAVVAALLWLRQPLCSMGLSPQQQDPHSPSVLHRAASVGLSSRTGASTACGCSQADSMLGWLTVPDMQPAARHS